MVLEFKVRAKKHQYAAIDEAIKTAQFVQNKCLRYWMDNKKVNKYDLNKYCRVLAHDFKFAKKLNSQARQSSAEKAWSAISHFYDNCKKKILGKKGYTRFKKNCRSVEYKETGWKLDLNTRKAIIFTDKKNIGRLRLVGSYDLHFYPVETIKRVRLVRRADGYYCQFILSVDVKIETKPTGKAIGLDVGLEFFYIQSKDLIAYEDLRIKNLVKNHSLAKSINDVAWYQFRLWLEYFGSKYGKITIAVPSRYTSQSCSNCGKIVKKSLSTRTHVCAYGYTLDRDENAACNILRLGLSTSGHCGTWLHDSLNAWGEDASTLAGAILLEQATSVNQESSTIATLRA